MTDTTFMILRLRVFLSQRLRDSLMMEAHLDPAHITWTNAVKLLPNHPGAQLSGLIASPKDQITSQRPSPREKSDPVLIPSRKR
jgi:hypothetical protein